MRVLDICDYLIEGLNEDRRSIYAKNFLVKKLGDKTLVTENSVKIKEAWEKLEYYDWVEVEQGNIGGDRLLKLTTIGRDHYKKHGSFSIYMKSLFDDEVKNRDRQELEDKLLDLSIEKAKKEIWQLKYWLLIAFVTAIVGALFSVLIQYVF